MPSIHKLSGLQKSQSFACQQKLLSKSELAESLGVSKSTITRWVQRRRISVLKIGYRTRFFQLERVLEDLERFNIKAIGSVK